MAQPKSLARVGGRAAVVLSFSFALIAAIPPRPGGAVPETVVRRVEVPLVALDARRPSDGLRLVDGRLRAVAKTETSRATVCSPVASTGLGITWRQPAAGAVHAEVAVERAGRWARPVHLDAEDDADPGTADATGFRGSTFLWVGRASCVRVALELDRGAAVRDVGVVFVASSGEVAAAGSVANALAAQPRIVSREEWGADPALMNCAPSVADEVRMGFVHHTAGTNDYTAEEADDVVRGVYAYHTDGRGWCDVGYNFLVDRFGTIYEGRSGGIELPVIGAAQMGFNTRAFSVSVMGNFETATVPAAVRRALVRVIAWRLDVAHVNPVSLATMVSAGGNNTRYDAGTEVRLPAISGHRDTGFTACPGVHLYALLPSIRDRVAARGLPKLWNPRLNVGTLTTGSPTNVKIRARGSEPLTWNVSVLDPNGALFASLGTQTSDRLDLVWPKAGPPAHPTSPGTYTIQVTATSATGAVARPASLPLFVSPSPSPSPSASP
jgi:hypothetical protein